MKSIYLDNAASTMVSAEVVKAMLPYLTDSYGNPSSIHTLGIQAHDAIEHARQIIAQKINAQPHEIIFTSGGTESNVLALNTSKYKITSAAEHSSILNSIKTSDCIVPVNNEGFVNIDVLKKKITKKSLISIIHGNNEIGTINDIEAIGKLCKHKGAVFHVDACQSFLKVPINVEKMNIDLLTLNSHKIHGPKGIGALFVRDGISLTPLFRGSQENNMRAGTQNVHGIVGFAKAVELWKESDNARMKKLRDMLINGLLSIPDSHLNGSRTKRLCNNVSISFKNLHGETIVKHLDAHNICASTGSACTSQKIEASHVLKAIGLHDEWALGSIRFSLSRYTTAEDIKKTIIITRTIIESLRQL